jgi:hypothetical protein
MPNIRSRIGRVVALTLGTMAAATLSTQAQQGILEACEADLAKFCEGVTPGNGHLIACMYAYEDQISEPCLATIVDFGDALDNMFYAASVALAACAPDIEKHCAGVQIGGGRILSCLSEVSSELSTDCQDMATKFRNAFVGE